MVNNERCWQKKKKKIFDTVSKSNTHIPARPITADVIITAFIHIKQDIVQNFNYMTMPLNTTTKQVEIMKKKKKKRMLLFDLNIL